MTQPVEIAEILQNYQKSHRESRKAALVVSIMSTVFVVLLLGYLFFSAHLQSAQFDKFTSAKGLPPEAAIHPSQMEMEYQRLKAMRFGYALIYRFSLSAAAIVVSLATIVMGSVLIFDRVAAPVASMLNIIRAANDQKIEASSPYPGLIMVSMGSLTLSLSVWLAGPGAPRISIADMPVFVVDPNYPRPNRSRITIDGRISSPSATARQPSVAGTPFEAVTDPSTE